MALNAQQKARLAELEAKNDAATAAAPQPPEEPRPAPQPIPGTRPARCRR